MCIKWLKEGIGNIFKSVNMFSSIDKFWLWKPINSNELFGNKVHSSISKLTFGFIIDSENQEKYFTHVSGIIDQISENDKVTFELEKGMRGMNAVKVTLKK